MGSVTQTAEVDACPGKCVHSLASLICDEVREEVQCPGVSMKCCVERGGGMPPLPASEKTTEKAEAKVKLAFCYLVGWQSSSSSQ